METLEALIDTKSIMEAAERLGLKPNTVSQRVSRMRLKEFRYEDWLSEYRRYRMRMPGKYVE